MTLATRRFLYIAFMLAFFIVTPLVVAYAAGYELVFSLSKPIHFQKTGMLILDSSPSDARIYINGELQQVFINKYLDKIKMFGSGGNMILTPAKIKNLLPGEYDVRLELDGYWPWQKKLSIRGGESTYAEDVYLFKKNLPFRLASGTFENLSVSPDSDYFAGTSENGLFAGRISDGSVSSITLAHASRQIEWSPASDSVLVGDHVYRISPLSESYSIASSTGLICSKLQWDVNDNRRMYCLTSDDSTPIDHIKAVNLENFSYSNIISSENIADFFIKDGHAHVISRIGETERLSIYKTDPQTHMTDFDLSKPYDYRFINPRSRYVNLFNNKQKSLSLIDVARQEPLAETLNNVNYSAWTGRDSILYSNDSEIWTYDLANNEKTLLTRISFPLDKVILHPSRNYVIFTTGNSIYDIELDNREKRSITELLKVDSVSSPFVSENGDSIFFIGKAGSQEGIYQLLIQ